MSETAPVSHRAVDVRDMSDKTLFTEWIRPHWASMYALARRMCGADVAEDVLQDALVSAWRKRAQFDPSRGTPRTWLLAIVANRARKRRFDVGDGHGDLYGGAVTENGYAPESIDLVRAMTQISERQRLALILHYYIGLPVADIANVMNCSTGTVKSTLSDARKRMKTLLGKAYR
jgi:RNA polymerase sigma-70 factor, ECF subfamily